MDRGLAALIALGLVGLGSFLMITGLSRSHLPKCSPGMVLMAGYDGKPVCVLGLQPKGVGDGR